MSSLLPVVDAHHHLWDLENLTYSWLKGPQQLEIHLAGDLTPIRKTYNVPNYLEDTKNQNVVKSVHLQAECSDGIAEAKWLQSLSDNHGFPHAIVAHANLASPKLRETLEVYRTLPNIRGIRQLLNYHPADESLRSCEEDYLKNDDWFKGLLLLAEYGYSFDLQVWQHQLAEAATIVARASNIQFVLNHTGMPRERTDAAYQEWRDGMSKLAANPNIAVKISGLGMTDHNWTIDSIRYYVLSTIEIFGIDRCMFASNFPIDKLLSDYDKLYNAFRTIISEFPPTDQVKLLHDNAMKYYRL
jgi:predicted TIM-barrel fold metal-dependent hydrolase